MMSLENNLFSRCHINKNEDGDRFVGVKADSDDAIVYFPIGYELPTNVHELRQDILHLISVLAEFTDRKDKLLGMQKFAAPQSVDFPINAYMEIINYFMEQGGYYTEKESVYKTSDRGKTDWPKTIRRQRPFIQSNESPVYMKQTVRASSLNDKNLITQIHKFCVYESFSKLGWLFTTYLPEKPLFEKDEKMFLSVLRTKLANTNTDKEKKLFIAMIAMLEYLDEQTSDKQFYFGTDRFEYVWEKLIDRVFGIKNKQDYFPRTKWLLNTGKKRTNSALEPDTIMICNEKIYVLDAKYYRFGISGELKDLPNSSSINKQVTYGEYISKGDKFKRKHGNDMKVYNAFIMPYNANCNLFGLTNRYENIGEAVTDSREPMHDYEHVQGIVVDVRYLMHHYTGKTNNQIMQLAACIESAFDKNEGCLPIDNSEVS